MVRCLIKHFSNLMVILLIIAWLFQRFFASYASPQLTTIPSLRVKQIEIVISGKDSVILRGVSSAAMGDGLGLFYRGQLACFLRVRPGGGFRIWDRKGRLALWLSSTPNGGRCGILDNAENVVAVLEAFSGKGHLILSDHNGQVLFEVPK